MPLFWSQEKCENSANVNEKMEKWVKSAHYCKGWQYIGVVYKIQTYGFWKTFWTASKVRWYFHLINLEIDDSLIITRKVLMVLIAIVGLTVLLFGCQRCFQCIAWVKSNMKQVVFSLTRFIKWSETSRLVFCFHMRNSGQPIIGKTHPTFLCKPQLTP